MQVWLPLLHDISDAHNEVSDRKILIVLYAGKDHGSIGVIEKGGKIPMIAYDFLQENDDSVELACKNLVTDIIREKILSLLN